jgi:hypothetical protein
MADVVQLIEALAERGVSITHIRKTLQNPEVLDRLAEDLRLVETRDMECLRSLAQVSNLVEPELLRRILEKVEPEMAERYGSVEMFRLLLGGRTILRWQAAAFCLYHGLNGQRMARADIARFLNIGTSSVACWLNGGNESYVRVFRDRDRELRYGSLYQYLPVSVVDALRSERIASPLGLYHYYVRGGWQSRWSEHDREAIEKAVLALVTAG